MVVCELEFPLYHFNAWHATWHTTYHLPIIVPSGILVAFHVKSFKPDEEHVSSNWVNIDSGKNYARILLEAVLILL